MPTDPRPRPDVTVPADLSAVRFDDRGLVPVITQDATTRQVLMLAWADAAALRHTLTERVGTYWSRSRQNLWVKGATSGHTQAVQEVRLDCDGDAVLYLVDQTGPACHTGTPTCFSTHLLPGQDLAGEERAGEERE